MAPVVTPTSRVLVGRDAELAELSSLLGVRASPAGPAHAHRTRSVLLGGDAGVGKTRLLTELRDLAFTEGWQVVAGHCLDFGDSALPYLPFTEILGRLAADHPDVVSAVSTAHPALTRLQPGRRVLSGELPGEPAAGAVDRTELFEALHALLTAVARTAPLLVVVEDAHWADQSTRDMLSFLFSRPVDAPGGLVVSYRADDLHRRHPLRRQVAEWARVRDVGRVQLSPLSASAVRDLVAELAPELDRDRLSTVTADIVARAEGNAFFVEELVGAAVSCGTSVELPVDLADVLLVRLDRLDDTARQVVRAASVSGRRVDHDMLRATAGLDDAALDAGLRGAVDLNVLIADRGAYAFRHALLGEAVYDDLLPGERVRLHAAYAAALTAGSAPGTAAELARHARAAMDLDTALEASVRAGREAALVGGPDEAAQHLQQALELLADPRRVTADGPDASKLAVEAGDALSAAGHPARAAALVAEQLDRLGADAPDPARARLLSARATYLYVVDTEEDLLALSRRAVDLVPDDAGGLRARVLANHARILAGYEEYDEARTAGLEALALAERLDLSAIASEAVTTVAGLKNAPVERVRAALGDAVAQAESVGALAAELRGRFLLARSYQDAGEWDEAVRWLRSAVDRARAGRVPWAPYGFESRWQWASIEAVRGNWETAERLVDTAGEVPPPLSAAMLGSVAVLLAQARGEDVSARLRELRRSWPQEGAVVIGSAGVEMLASDDPVGVYDDAVELLSRLWHPWFGARVRFAATALSALAERAPTLEASRREEVLAQVERLLTDGQHTLAHHDDPAQWGPEGRAWALRMEAEATRARWLLGVSVDQDALVEAWVAAAASYDGMGHVLETARCRVVLAGVLRATGDTAGSRAAADAARDTAQRLGLAPMLEQLRALGSTPTRSAEPAAELTPRESEILGLVAQGRSNGEIGTQLFISTKTVSVHVSNILAKLGAAGRTEAAAIARRRGLLP